MTPEQQRIAIATACGLKDIHWMSGFLMYGRKLSMQYVPNYTEDLNACHEMEKVLGVKIPNYFEYLTEGDDDYEGCYKAMMATAPQRCEAFLKTIGKWKEDGATETKVSGEK